MRFLIEYYNKYANGEVRYAVTDLLGHEVARGNLAKDHSTKINTQAFSNGIYFINIFVDSRIAESKKLILLK